jgi:hypothetical protein
MDGAVKRIKKFPCVGEKALINISALKVTRAAEDRPRDSSLQLKMVQGNA